MVLSLIFIVCEQQKNDDANEMILAQIGKKSISVNEYIRRTEYTIRPPYCSLDNQIHKKIVLNSLIAEKLFALEAGEDNELTRNEHFQDYLQGRKEQAMRQWQYHEVAYSKVKMDTNEINKAFQLAGRAYQLEYCSHSDSGIILQIQNHLATKSKSFAEIYRQFFGLEEVPRREVSWDSSEDPIVFEALFSDKLAMGQIIGPIKTTEDNYLLLQVSGWRNRPAISDYDIQQRWKNVSEKLQTLNANSIYADLAAKVMKGKRVEFSRDTFLKLANVVAPFYLKSLEDKRQAFQQKFWENEKIAAPDEWQLDEMIDQSLLRIDNQTWSVKNFLKEINIHPLVFRQQKIGQSEFPEQFKLAIVDLIRDKYLTQEAYRQDYDEVNAVKRNIEMWQDNLLALYQKNLFLSSHKVEESDYLKVIDTFLNPFIDSLQSKYSAVIKIDTEHWEKIQSTKINMFALQKNVPYPIIVPSFPLVTTDHALDYGKKMN